MDFSLREWLIIVGVVVIIAVLLDGYRRVRSGKRNSLKMAIDKSLNFREGDRVDYFNGELPSGGARIVNRPTEPEQLDEDQIAGGARDELTPEPLFVDDEETVPQESLEAVEPEIDDSESEPGTRVEQEPQPEGEAIEQEVEEVIVINVFAKDESGLNGADIMRVILACGMRYGDMNIFHRNESEDGNGRLQFSMANAVKPGTFDLDAMDHFYTPGVSFFLSLPGPRDSMKAFDYMLETAQCLVNNLSAELRDELHSVMTKQTIEHSRQKIRDFERRQLSLLG